MGGQDSLWSRYVTTVSTVDRSVGYGLGKWGRFVAGRPATVIAVSLIVSIALSAGMVLIPSNTETESDKLWVPQDSLWIKQEEYLEPRLGNTDRVMNMIFESKDGSNILTAEALREMFGVYEAMENVTTAEDGRVNSWTDGICWKNALGLCRAGGILRLFDDNVTQFEVVAAQGQVALLRALSTDTYPDGSPVTQEDIFSDFERSPDGTIASARMVQWRGLVDPDISDDLNSDWGNDVEDVLEPGKPGSDTSIVSVFFSVPTSVDNAIGESVGGDIALVTIAIIVICVFADLALFVRDKVYNRTSLAEMGIVTVGLSICSGFGLSLFFTIPFTSLSRVLPFILLGIGVDDMFVLVRSVEEVDERFPGLPIPDRFEKALNLGGVSITVTSATNVAAFLFGSMTTIPAVKWFCWSAAIAITMDWILQLTLFLGCFILTERRIEANRLDCCCCWHRDDGKPGGAPNTIVTIPEKPIGLMSANPKSYLQQMMNRFVLPVSFHPAGKAVVMLVVIGLAVVGAVGIKKLDEGLPLGSLAPDDHYFRHFDDMSTIFESSSGYSGSLYFRNVDQSDPVVQQRMLQAYDQALASEYISAELSPDVNWLTQFQTYAAQVQPNSVDERGAVLQSQFYSLLTGFLEQEPVWKDRIHRRNDDEAEEIEVSSFQYVHVPNVDDAGEYDRKLISDLLDLGKDINRDVFSAENDATDEGDVAFLHAGFYKYFETNRIIFRELMLNLAFALVGIAIISCVLLIHPTAVLIILLCVALVDMMLFAEMWVFNIKLNTVSVVNLVMAVGLSVDYSMHVLHTFLQKRGETRQERVKKAMLEIGAAVLLGVLSTLLGVVILAGSSSEIIRVFFKLLTGTVIFGGVVGMFFLPALLTLVGPSPCLLREEDEQQSGDADGKKTQPQLPVSDSNNTDAAV